MKEKDDGDLFINKLVDLLNWFAQQVRRERLKLHRQLSSVLQVGRSLFFEIFFIWNLLSGASSSWQVCFDYLWQVTIVSDQVCRSQVDLLQWFFCKSPAWVCYWVLIMLHTQRRPHDRKTNIIRVAGSTIYDKWKIDWTCLISTCILGFGLWELFFSGPASPAPPPPCSPLVVGSTMMWFVSSPSSTASISLRACDALFCLQRKTCSASFYLCVIFFQRDPKNWSISFCSGYRES